MADDDSLDWLRKLYPPTISAQVTAQDVMTACPYNHMRNMDGHLTPALFYADFFHVEDALEQVVSELETYLTSTITNNRVVFLSGYSGSGKSTFLHYFAQRHADQWNSYFLDFGPGRTHRSEDAIALLLRHEIPLIDDEAFRASWSALTVHMVESRRYFSDAFIDAVHNAGSSPDVDLVLRDATTTDLILLYFFVLFQYEANSPRAKQMSIVYFDNLDEVEMDYLSEAFRGSFVEALRSAAELSHDKVFLPSNLLAVKRFRFIFCLREANSASVDAQIADSIGNVILSVPYRLQLPASYYTAIVLRRLEIIKRLRPQDKTVSTVIWVMEQYGTDSFLSTVLANVFNGDYRIMIQALFSMAGRNHFRDIKQVPFSLLRGAFIHGAIQFLRDRSVTRDYVEWPRGRDLIRDGYCHPLRFCLTVIQNLMVTVPGLGSPTAPWVDNSTTLFELMLEMKGSDIYPLDDWLKLLEQTFLYHQVKWVHLIQIHGKLITREGDFAARPIEQPAEPSTKEWIEYYLENRRPGDNSFTLDVEVARRLREAENHLRNIKVRLTPAGYGLLRHLLPHFEFYSVLGRGAHVPLHLANIYNRDNLQIIDGVLGRAARHIGLMATFYDNVFAKRGFTAQGYEASPYSWKWFGWPSTYFPTGMFHGARIVFHHIQYIDDYRRWLLRQSYDTDLKVMLNKDIIDRIVRYVELLDSVSDHRCKPAAIAFRECIASIADAQYVDFRSPIRWSDDLTDKREARARARREKGPEELF